MTDPVVAPGGAPLGSTTNRLGLVVGLLIALMVAGMYGAARSLNTWPSGHPWSGIMWSFIAYMTLRTSVRGYRMPPVVSWITLAFSVVGCAIWAWATFGGML